MLLLHMHNSEEIIIGAALSAHQVEGNNIHSDWWRYEELGKLPVSGLSADHYTRFKEDFKLAKHMGLDSIRLSIEWAKIEPTKGVIDPEAIAHYHDVCKELQVLGLTPMITLHHYTLPQWIEDDGGIASKDFVIYFSKYVEIIAKEFGLYADFWLTFNEPEQLIIDGYIQGSRPPFKKSYWEALRAYISIIRAHRKAYQVFKEIVPNSKISIAKNILWVVPYRAKNILDVLATSILNYVNNILLLHFIYSTLDFIGVNYYFSRKIVVDIHGIEFKEQTEPFSDMGSKTYSKGLYFLLEYMYSHLGKNIYVTENGIANATDEMRTQFIKEHLDAIREATEIGIPVLGYYYWALLDTYEWESGYDLKFGLIEINYETQTRKIRNTVIR